MTIMISKVRAKLSRSASGIRSPVAKKLAPMLNESHKTSPEHASREVKLFGKYDKLLARGLKGRDPIRQHALKPAEMLKGCCTNTLVLSESAEVF